MRLLITTPLSVVMDVGNAQYIRAEDETGAFGILKGHADFITVLSISVVTWKDEAGKEHHVAVRGGILTVTDGELVEIATREAVKEDILAELGEALLERFKQEATADEESRVSSTRLHLAAIRKLQNYLHSARENTIPQMPQNVDMSQKSVTPER